MLTFYEDIYISELRDELSKVRRLWAKGPWGSKAECVDVLILILGSKHGQPMTVAVGRSK